MVSVESLVSMIFPLPALPGPTRLQASGVQGWNGRFKRSAGFAPMPYVSFRPWSWRWLNDVVWLNVSLVLVWSGLIEAEQYCKIPELWVSHFFPLPPSPLAKTILNSPGNGSHTIWDQTLCPFHNPPQNFSPGWSQGSLCQLLQVRTVFLLGGNAMPQATALLKKNERTWQQHQH